ncbi:MAG: SufD family Fe-S cluster assembly protein, partial [Alkalispirochaeta sp.]
GLINVDHAALDTDAYLTNNNLILSDDGQADSIPSLEISTDEVRCSHGSTTGKLDPRQIYYLQTRGYSSEEARRLLLEGYFEEVLSKYPEVVADELRGIVDDRISD